MNFEYYVEGGDFSNAGAASSAVKKILKQLDIESSIIKRVVIGMYEAEVNIVAHAYKGVITVKIDEEKINIVLADQGPGIADIERAMQEGYSTASPTVREMGFGAGMGLPNMKNNADKLNISSKVGEGTTVELTVYFKN
ncbi:MAG: anti-sigma regulatory factor [Bacteroidales bacterium]